MSSENQNTQNESSSSDGAGDLSASLSGGETEFVISDEKKAGTPPWMYLLLLAAVAGGGGYFMYQRSGPASAEASLVTPEAAAAEQTINTFLTSGPDGIKMMQNMLKDTEKVVQQFLDYPSVTQIPLSALHTNPFRFAKPDANGKTTPDAELAKRKREEEKQAAIKASEALQLQSIMHSGSRKACMINNTLYSEGQQVEQFTIEKIEPARVIVKTGTYRFEIKMQR
jgi:hypothetical protein